MREHTEVCLSSQGLLTRAHSQQVRLSVHLLYYDAALTIRNLAVAGNLEIFFRNLLESVGISLPVHWGLYCPSTLCVLPGKKGLCLKSLGLSCVFLFFCRPLIIVESNSS